MQEKGRDKKFLGQLEIGTVGTCGLEDDELFVVQELFVFWWRLQDCGIQ